MELDHPVDNIRIEQVYCSYSVLYEAGSGGHLHVLQWFVSIGLNLNDMRVRGYLTAAALAGDLRSINWAIYMGATMLIDALVAAVRADRLAIVQRVMQVKLIVPSGIIHTALELERFGILDYIHNNYSWRCTVRTQLSAAAMEWLRFHGQCSLRDSFEIVRQYWSRGRRAGQLSDG